MKIRYATLVMAFAVLLAAPAWALDLHQARSSGMVGEKLDGYVAALKKTPEVTALVVEVNGKRQQEYMRISKENGQPVSVVAKLAAGQIINSLDTGSPYQDANGQWKIR